MIDLCAWDPKATIVGLVIAPAPPLTVTKKELDRAPAILDECLTDVERRRRRIND